MIWDTARRFWVLVQVFLHIILLVLVDEIHVPSLLCLPGE